MMLKEANELMDTAVLSIFRKQGIEIGTEGINNVITRSQKAPSPKPTNVVPLPRNPKSKLSGQDPATTLTSPTIPF